MINLKSYRLLIIATAYILISIINKSGSNQPRVVAQAGTPVPTVTGWPTQTPTRTPTPIPSGVPSLSPTPTSFPGPPILIYPPDGALLPQPVAPEEWYFNWDSCVMPCFIGIQINGPGGRRIGASGYYLLDFHYVADDFLPEDALGPWTWQVGVSRPAGSNQSEVRTFFVQSNTIKSSPPSSWLYFPAVMHVRR